VEQVPPTWIDRLETTLLFAAGNAGLSGDEARDEVEWVLHRLELTDRRDQSWGELSGGFKMRFALAKALVTRPRLLILDEPLAPLDPLTQQMFLRDLRDLANSRSHPMAIVLSSQELYEVESIADQVLFMSAGRKPTHYGSPASIASGRTTSLFEISGPPDVRAVELALPTWTDSTVERFGTNYIITTPSTLTSSQLLESLLAAGLLVRYFRDISSSARRLFEDERRRS
jgi:ABC-2 type transport system ATP-binding protein